MAKVTDILVPLIGLVTAAIPLMLAVVGLRTHRSGRSTAPLETVSMTIVSIKRLSVEKHVWKSMKIKHHIRFTLNMIILIFVSPIVFAFIFGTILQSPNEVNLLGVLLILIVIASLLLAVIYIDLYINSYLFRCHNADQGRYAIFKEAWVLIESNYLYLFNKCHEILKVMGTQVIEADFYAQRLEAFTPGSFFSPARCIEIQIQAMEGKEGLYSVLLRAAPFVHRENKEETSVSSIQSSRVINRFINQLISTTEVSDKKPQKEMVTA